MFKSATRQQSKLRMTLDGPAGSGKSYTALRFAHALANGGKIAAIDTERGSLSKYVDEAPDGIPWAFDVMELTTFSPQKYTEAIQAAGRSGYSVLIIDSLSHAWEGTGGSLEMKQKAGDSWSAWRHVTPFHNAMVDAILQSPCHVITTMRSRMEYVQETDERGKVVIRRVGMSPVQRPGMEYEFDILCDMDWMHILTVGKSRCSAVADKVYDHPGPEFMRPVIEWLSSGSAKQETPAFVPATAATIATPATTVPTDDAPGPGSAIAPFTLDELLQTFGPDAVMAACDNKFPETDVDLGLLALKLAGGG